MYKKLWAKEVGERVFLAFRHRLNQGRIELKMHKCYSHFKSFSTTLCCIHWGLWWCQDWQSFRGRAKCERGRKVIGAKKEWERRKGMYSCSRNRLSGPDIKDIQTGEGLPWESTRFQCLTKVLHPTFRETASTRAFAIILPIAHTSCCAATAPLSTIGLFSLIPPSVRLQCSNIRLINLV